MRTLARLPLTCLAMAALVSTSFASGCAGGDADTNEPDAWTFDISNDMWTGEEDLSSGGDLVQVDAGAEACPCAPDGILCTLDECDDAGVCQHTPLNPLQGGTIGLLAPDFTLMDRNPESTSYSQPFTLSTRGDKVAVLMFHSATCLPCLSQSKAARLLYADYADNADVLFATINTPDGATHVDDYVQADPADVEGPAPPTLWPVLEDTAATDVWAAFCADTDRVIVVDRAGIVVYDRAVNFQDAIFRQEVADAIDGALSGTFGE